MGKFRRRDFLVGVAGLGSVGAGLEMKREIRSRSAEVAAVGRFLRGQTKEGETEEKITIGEKELSREDLAEDLVKIITSQSRLGRKAITKAQVLEVMDAFSYVIELEDKFGGQLNTLPSLEAADQAIEKVAGKFTDRKSPLASSFGLSQVKPKQARVIALRYKDELTHQGFIKEKDSAVLENPNIPDTEIVDRLDLRGKSNIIYGFLSYYEALDYYGRDSRGLLHSNREHDPRAHNLAISAYSAKPTTPIAAKIQTKLNELTSFRLEEQKNQQDGDLLVPDGDFGPKSLERLSRVLGEEGLNLLQELKSKKVLTVSDLTVMEKQIDKLWKPVFREFVVNNTKFTPKQIRQIISGRYHAINSTYKALRSAVPRDEREKAKEFLDNFVNRRDEEFLEMLESEDKFLKEFPKGDYRKFFYETARVIPQLVEYDNRYKGYVPLGYGSPSYPGADPKNVMSRVILYLDLSDSKSKIK